MSDDTGLALERTLDGQVGHRLDEAQVVGVRARGTREVAGLLNHDLLGVDLLGELLGEPLAGVDRVELDVAEGVALDLATGSLDLRDDLGDASALRQEDVDVALLVHDRLEALGLGVQIDLHLGHEDGVDVPTLLRQADRGHPLLGLEPLVVAVRTRSGQPPAVAAHDLVDDEHAGVGAMLTDNVLGVLRHLFGGGPSAEGLTDRHHVVVDGLGQAHDGQVVVVLLQVGSKVGGRRIGVVATDGVQDINAVGAQLLGSLLQRILILGDEAALDQVFLVRQLDAGVTDRGSAVTVEDGCVLTSLLVHQHVVAGEQAVVAILVSDDLDGGINFVVALDESTDSGGQARGEATCGQQGNTTDRHECHLSQVG